MNKEHSNISLYTFIKRMRLYIRQIINQGYKLQFLYKNMHAVL